MEVSFYITRNTFEVLPALTFAYCEGSMKTAYTLMLSWFQFTAELSWER